MKIFISGSTGFIGSQLALKLASEGHTVHALYRSLKKASTIVHPNIQLFQGDILNFESIVAAMKGCEQIYHTAAFTEVWARDEKDIYDLNVQGTLNVLNAANELQVCDIVLTSTAGVFGPSTNGEINEATTLPSGYFIEYERTKAIAEKRALQYLNDGLNIRIVNPTRVFGPGILGTSNSVTILIARYIRGRWRLIPGNGNSIGNYAYIDDVVNGHILAMRHGKPGENYLLGGENISYNDFFSLVGKISGHRRLLLKVPVPVMFLLADFAMLANKLFGIKPFITRWLVKKFSHNWPTSSSKAIKEFGYEITPIEMGIKYTIEWLKNYNHGR